MTDTLEPRAALYAALAKAQGEFPTIPRNKSVPGRSYTFKYASLDTILEKVRPALAANGFAVSQAFRGDDLVTSLLHASGEHIESALAVHREGGNWQEFGSAVTYARRYTLTALLGIASEEDDDGEAAAKPRPRRKETLPPVRDTGDGDEIPFGEPNERERLHAVMCDLASQLGNHDEVVARARSHRERNPEHVHVAWLKRSIEKAETRLLEREDQEQEP